MSDLINENVSKTKRRAKFDDHVSKLSRHRHRIKKILDEIDIVVRHADDMYAGLIPDDVDVDAILKDTLQFQHDNARCISNHAAAVKKVIETAVIKRRREATKVTASDVVQRFEVGNIVTVNIALRDDPNCAHIRGYFGALHSRVASSKDYIDARDRPDYYIRSRNARELPTRESIAHNRQCKVEDILDFNDEFFTIKLRQVSYRQLFDRTTNTYQVLPDHVMATIVDAKTSKTYVEVIYGDPVTRAWMRRDELVVMSI